LDPKNLNGSRDLTTPLSGVVYTFLQCPWSIFYLRHFKLDFLHYITLHYITL